MLPPKVKDILGKTFGGVAVMGICRWLPAALQARNTRRTVWVLLNGERMPLAEAAERLGRPRATVWGWLKKTRVPDNISMELTQ